MLKSKFIYIVSLFVTIVYLIIAFVSCENENPIINNDYQFDSARFTIQSDLIPFQRDGYYSPPWSPDTNEVFLINDNFSAITHYKNGVFEQIRINQNLDIKPYLIDGISPNEGYLICSIIRNNKYEPYILKWNGNSFEPITFSHNYYHRFAPTTMLIKNSNEIWIGDENTVHKFDGNSLIQYNMPDPYVLGIGGVCLYSDENNRLKYLTVRYNGDIDTVERDRIYEFTGTEWIKVFEYIHPLDAEYIDVLGKDVYTFNKLNENTIKKLNGNVLTPYMKIENFIPSYRFVGNSLTDFVAFGRLKNSIPYANAFHWNGNKWSKEDKEISISSERISNRNNNNNYFISVSNGGVSYMYRIKRKI